MALGTMSGAYTSKHRIPVCLSIPPGFRAPGAALSTSFCAVTMLPGGLSKLSPLQ